MNKRSFKGWLYLLPAILFLGAFMVYPLVDVFVYSFEEGYNSASQSFFGTGLYNYSYVLRDEYFLQALKNTFLLVVITVPLSTGLALLSRWRWARSKSCANCSRRSISCPMSRTRWPSAWCS